jgi:hypothetical protein
MPRKSGAYLFLALPAQNPNTPLLHSRFRKRQINRFPTTKLVPLL